MFQRRGFLLVIALTLTLSGCFRQADDDFEPVDSNNQGVQETIPTNPPIEPTATLDESGIGVVTSTPVLPPTETPFEPTATEDAPLPFATDADDIEVASNTPIPFDTPDQQVQPTDIPQPTNTQPSSTIGDLTPTEEPTFITPVAPGANIPPSFTPWPTNTLLPGQSTTLDPTPTGIAIISDECVYIVQPGDNLYRIAVNNNTTLAQLRAVNPQITGDLIQPGDELLLPAEDCTEGGVDAGVEIQVTTDGTLPEGIQAIHVVQAGETLNIIARRYGVTISAIAAANEVIDINRISINQELRIPFPEEDN